MTAARMHRRGPPEVIVVEQVPRPRPSVAEALIRVHAAAIPLSALTAWQALFDHGRITGGMTVLILGGGGAVGSFAVQIARWAGAKVAATASAGNADFVRGLGAETVIDSGTERIEEVADNFDVVLDTVGGEMLARGSACVREGGALIAVARLPATAAGHERAVHPVFFVVKPDALELGKLAELADAGRLRPLVAEVYPLGETRAAYGRIANGRVRGKVAIKVADRSAALSV
jgi:NADPH:quinone reductase-like Zn-dependent oxidoreductase